MISHYRAETEHYTPERCFINELYQSRENEECSIARARVTSGATTKLHALQGIDERYVILEGEGLVEVDGKPPEPVSYLDVITIPAGKPQRITNTGRSDLIFLCVCTPRFRPECYMDLSGIE